MSNKRNLTVDYLRGIAILWVMFLHFWEITWLPFGQIAFFPITGSMGVDLFFFISGFCLLESYVEEFTIKPRYNIAQFWKRRFLKILPSYWFLLLAVFFISAKWRESLVELIGHLLKHLLFIQNLFPYESEWISGVTWSLCVEVQFYLIFPLLVIAYQKSFKLTHLLLCLFAVIYRLFVYTVFDNSNSFWINQLPGCLDLFSWGILTSFLLKRKYLINSINWLKYSTVRWIIVLIFVATIYYIYLGRYDPGLDYFKVFLRPIFGLLYCLFLIVNCENGKFQPSSYKLLLFTLKYFALTSYNIYLWHQFIARNMLKISFFQSSNIDPHSDFRWQLSFFILALFISISWGSFLTNYLEKKFIFRERLIR